MIAPTQIGLPATNVPLRNGDHLDAAEFCRRWELTPFLKHAELIGGQVFMNPPISAGGHGVPHSNILLWFGVYAASTAGTQAICESSVHFGPKDLPQPDGLLRIRDEYGGSSRFRGDELYGPPELIVEIAASSAGYDLFNKKQMYLEQSVQEYLVWIVYEKKFVWFEKRDDQYVQKPAMQSGILKSAVFPGLWLDTRAILADHQIKVLRTLQKGLDSPEHAEFVTRLKSAARKKKRDVP
jgi:Uma2 family endonuclease